MSEPLARRDVEPVVEKLVDHLDLVSAARPGQRVDAHDADDRRVVEGGREDQRRAHALTDEHDAIDRAVRAARARSATSAAQSDQRVASMSSTVVPCPGRAWHLDVVASRDHRVGNAADRERTTREPMDDEHTDPGVARVGERFAAGEHRGRRRHLDVSTRTGDVSSPGVDPHGDGPVDLTRGSGGG